MVWLRDGKTRCREGRAFKGQGRRSRRGAAEGNPGDLGEIRARALRCGGDEPGRWDRRISERAGLLACGTGPSARREGTREGRAVSAGRARGSGSCGSRLARAGPEVWAVRGEGERGGRGPSWEKKRPRAGLRVWAGLGREVGCGLGFVLGFSFLFLFPIQTKLFEFKQNLNSTPMHSNKNKAMHQHECNKNLNL